MKGPVDATQRLLSRAGEDGEFRARLLANPKDAVERELGVTLAEGHEIHVHEETDTATHVVLPPRSRLTAEEREAARTGAASLEFLKKTMYDPAPPIRPPASRPATARASTVSPETLAGAGRESIRRGLAFLESAIDENGAWHCIRFNLANPDIPRHFERPPFVSALCVLAWKVAMKRGREPCAPVPERILPAPSNIPDCGATTAICPRISTVPRSARLPSGRTPGYCWEGTFREYWRIATGKAAS